MTIPSPGNDGRYGETADSERVLISGTDGVQLIVSTPAADENLWEKYLDGALRSYRHYGAETALDYSAIRDGASTSLYYALVDNGVVVGGVRAQGPYRHALESHAVIEWSGNAPSQWQIHDDIATRIPYGVVEMKSAWVAPSSPYAGKLSAALARVALPTMERLNIRYVMATAADHVLQRWESSGGRVNMDIPAAPYPDARYRTRIMWWDRHTLATDADPALYRKMSEEHQHLYHRTSCEARRARHEESPTTTLSQPDTGKDTQMV